MTQPRVKQCGDKWCKCRCQRSIVNRLEFGGKVIFYCVFCRGNICPHYPIEIVGQHWHYRCSDCEQVIGFNWRTLGDAYHLGFGELIPRLRLPSFSPVRLRIKETP